MKTNKIPRRNILQHFGTMIQKSVQLITIYFNKLQRPYSKITLNTIIIAKKQFSPNHLKYFDVTRKNYSYINEMEETNHQ